MKKKEVTNNTFEDTDDLVRNHAFCGLWITDHIVYNEWLDQNKEKQNAKQKMGRLLVQAQLWRQHACSGVFPQLFQVEIQGMLHSPAAIVSFLPLGSCPV